MNYEMKELVVGHRKSHGLPGAFENMLDAMEELRPDQYDDTERPGDSLEAFLDIFS